MANLQTAVFGGGCFWCTEAIFKSLRGVESVLPGYSGGSVVNPSYEQVCSGGTGHVEAIEIKFDPDKIRYNDLLTVFFATHDPTTKNRQGNDVGEQYQSTIFYLNPEQERQAKGFVAGLEKDGAFERPIVTDLKPFTNFYEAEDYHQNYFARNPGQPYCQAVISPKLKKFKEHFAQLLS